MTFYNFVLILYILLSISTFMALYPHENLAALIARILLAATWPFIWTVRIINRLTYWIFHDD